MTATGQPWAAPNASISAGSTMGSVVPGTGSTPTRRAASRAEILSPITSIAAGGGPMKATPRAVTALAKSAFSLKNP